MESPVKKSTGVLYEVEDILDHKKMPNGKNTYLVKWKGYDSAHNSWEPENHFASFKMLMDYHESKGKAMKPKFSGNVSNQIKGEMEDMKQMAGKENIMDNDKIDVEHVEQESDSPASEPPKKYDYLSGKEIVKNRLIPEKVLNIFHVKNDEKSLIAHIQFKNRSEPAYVSAPWANRHCPQMVIKFYESRIYWQQQSSGELIKAEYASSA